jgi:hypothetical protein
MIRLALHLVCCVLLIASVSPARNKDKKLPEKDSFDVVGHLVLDGGVVNHLVATKHFSSNYVYAESSDAHTLAVIDVTDAAHPRVLSVVNRTGSLLTAAGDAALVSADSPTPAAIPSRTISILDFSDKANPKVTREFVNVTSIGYDDQRGLVFLVNGEGMWVLHRNQPLDPEIQERYAHDVIYNH